MDGHVTPSMFIRTSILLIGTRNNSKLADLAVLLLGKLQTTKHEHTHKQTNKLEIHQQLTVLILKKFAFLLKTLIYYVKIYYILTGN